MFFPINKNYFVINVAGGNMKKFLMIVLILSIIVTTGFGKKLADLPELMKPSLAFFVDDTQIYIPEGAIVNIYSKNDYKLKKKFGKAGEGPMEFRIIPQLPLTLDAKGENLVVFSIGKVSYFNKQGEFIKEIKTSAQVLGLQVFENKFIGRSRTQDESGAYDTINIYDSALKKIREIARNKSAFQGPGKGLEVLGKPFQHAINENKILLTGKDDATVDIFDADMKKLHSINIDRKRIPMKQDFKDQITDFLKNDPATKNFFEILKPIKLPNHFPVIAAFIADENVVYILTWTENPTEFGCSVYGFDGKFIKEVSIPIKFQNSFTPYPIAIHKNVLYQIVENDLEEIWELHASAIK